MDEQPSITSGEPDSLAKKKRPKGFSFLRRALRVVPALLVLWGVLVYASAGRLNPKGTHVVGSWHKVPADSVALVTDLTWTGPDGATVRDQNIFDALFDLIARAETFLVVDFFLINDFAGDPETAPRALSGELIDALVEAKTRRPELLVLLITDPINRVYGSETHPGFKRLEALGIDVVETRLERLRDSNPLYSSIYRLLFSWSGNQTGGGFLPNPFLPDDETTLRSWLRLLNFKANHRKVAIAGRLGEPALGLVTSANPHDASSGHSNVALLFQGAPALDLLDSEITVARFSGWREDKPLRALAVEARRNPGREDRLQLYEALENLTPLTAVPSAPGVAGERAIDPALSPLSLRILTEGAIRDAMLGMVALARDGDTVDVAMFYFGHRDIIEALVAAAQRGARVRLILDPNRDAFGRTKNGIPNRSVANELLSRSRLAAGDTRSLAQPISVRWYKTQGEQFHTKLTMVSLQEDCCGRAASHLLLGSANFTRRNLDDFNLETNVEVHMNGGARLEEEVHRYLDRLWSNGTEGEFTLDYEAFADPSKWSHLKYRWMEKTGLSTF